MKKLAILLTVVFLSAVLIMPAQATIKKVAQTGLQFLKLDVGGRAAAMGGAFMMVGNDANALFYNPAGAAYVPGSLDFFATQTQWVADITYSAGALVKNLGNWGTVGLSYLTSDYGDDIIGTVVSTSLQGYEETGKLELGAYTIGLAYARMLTNKFSIGGQVKYVSQHLGSSILTAGGNPAENKVNSVAYDVGTIFYPGFKSFRLGMAVRNFSPQLKYQQEGFQLPLTFTVGFAMDMLDLMGEHPNHSLVMAVDAIHPRDYTERIHVGGEYWFMNMLAVRAGYKSNYDVEGLTAGIGAKYGVGGVNLKVDYSYSDFGAFDAINRFSVGVSF